MLSTVPYHTASEALALHLIWRASLVLAGASLVIIAGLILRRGIDHRIRQRQKGRHEFISRVLLAAIAASAGPFAATLPRLEKSDYPVVVQVALDLLRAIKGQDVVRIVQVLAAWEVMPHLRRMLEHGSHSDKIRALTLLSHFEDEESLDYLCRYAEDVDPYVQLAALHGLAERQAMDQLPHILAQLAYSDRQNTMLLADVLQRFGDTAAPMLVALASGQAPQEVREASLIALGTIRSLGSVKPLIAIAESDPLPDIRAQAISALGRIGDIRAGKVVIRALDEPEYIIRLHATQAAGKLRLNDALPHLAALLSDSAWWVRYRAAEALLRLNASSLLKHKATQHDTAGEVARMMLAEWGIS